MRAIFFCGVVMMSFTGYAKHMTTPEEMPEDYTIESHWDWSKIDTSQIYFPPNFMWGTATAAYQVEGNSTNTNWYKWEQHHTANGKPTIKRHETAGLACDHWNRFEDDIKLMQELGVTAYRFSVEWSKIEPEEGIFDEAALEHYSWVCDVLLAAGIQPVITLYHFSHPLWFDQRGSFESDQNIDYFVRFCSHVFSRLSDRVTHWCTINEADTYAAHGYVTGMFPPGKIGKLGAAMELVKNLVEAHVRVYHTLKKLPRGNTSQIGFVKNITQFDPAGSSWNIVNRGLCTLLNYCFNDVILNFFMTGIFTCTIPGLVWINHVNDQAPQSLDFIGLNYYSHFVVHVAADLHDPVRLIYYPEDIMTDLPYALYAPGLYRAIQQVGKLGAPIYITENGIPDERDDRRDLFLQQYLFALSCAIRDGYDIRGFFYWSLIDNFEWSEGFDPKFGLYHVDYATQQRTLRPGADYFIKTVKNFSKEDCSFAKRGDMYEYIVGSTASAS